MIRSLIVLYGKKLHNKIGIWLINYQISTVLENNKFLHKILIKQINLKFIRIKNKIKLTIFKVNDYKT
jgi:hypothetical protein